MKLPQHKLEQVDYWTVDRKEVTVSMPHNKCLNRVPVHTITIVWKPIMKRGWFRTKQIREPNLVIERRSNIRRMTSDEFKAFQKEYDLPEVSTGSTWYNFEIDSDILELIEQLKVYSDEDPIPSVNELFED